MNCSLYLINASENNINWFERRLGSFYYENTGVNKLSENDLVYFVFESKVTLAVKSSSHKPFREIKTFDLSKKISEFIINLDSNRRIKPHVINNIRLKEISIDRPLKIDELLPLLYTELLRIYSKSSSNLLYEEQMNYKSELIDFFENEIEILYQTLNPTCN